MLRPRFVVCVLPVAMLSFGAGPASGQSYPSKPIRIVTSQAGGGQDVTARVVARGITGLLGQNVIIVNSRTQYQVVANAPPDGYTLLAASSSFVLGPLFEPQQYDPVRDFSPIAITGKAPNIMAVHPSLPVKSVKELIALARAKPGLLNYGTSIPGSKTHLATELFKSMAGVDIMGIPYVGAGPAIISTIVGETQLIISSVPSVAPHAKTGRLKALAITSLQPSALAPGLPTVAASGLPGYEFESFDAIFAPAKTPAAIVDRLNRELKLFLTTAEAKAKFLAFGLEAVGSAPEELGDKVRAEQAKWNKLLKRFKETQIKSK